MSVCVFVGGGGAGSVVIVRSSYVLVRDPVRDFGTAFCTKPVSCECVSVVNRE